MCKVIRIAIKQKLDLITIKDMFCIIVISSGGNNNILTCRGEVIVSELTVALCEVSFGEFSVEDHIGDIKFSIALLSI